MRDLLSAVDAVAHPTPPEPEPPQGSADEEGPPLVRGRAYEAAPWVVERDRRRRALGLDAGLESQDEDAAVAAESSVDEGSSGDLDDESDNEEEWWLQTWYGGSILRDGDPDDSVVPDAPPAGQLEDTAASQTESPAAVAAQQRRSVPRMPLCEKPASIPGHREKERLDMQYF